jgi:ferredoxin--NADP+ reductase
VPELIGLAGVRGLNVVVDTPVDTEADTTKGQVLAELAARPVDPSLPTIVLRFLTSPVRILGEDRVTGVEVVRNRLEPDADGTLRPVATGETETIDCGLVVRAAGYHGEPVADLPYDAATGTVPNDRGRVAPGVYVAGWVKRGPTGFIGTNKTCAQETVARILDDLDAGLPEPVGTRESIASVVRGRQPDVVDLKGWRAIDAEEQRRGAERGRVRVKIVDVDEMLRVAAPPIGEAPRLRVARRRYAAVRSPEKRS